MNIFEGIARMMQRLGKKELTIKEINENAEALAGEIYVRELAFWSCVNLVANSLAKCEFKTFDAGKEARGTEYYLWNYSPNKNQSSSAFIHKWVAQLFRNNECLIVNTGNQMFVADSFVRDRRALTGDVFSGVTVDEHIFQRNFSRGDVLFFQLSHVNMREITAGIYDAYNKLIETAMRGYEKSKGTKYKFAYESIPVPYGGDREKYYEAIKKWMGPFIQASSAVMPVGKGENIEELGKAGMYGDNSTRDIRAMIDDISDLTARGFLIPPALVRGDVQDTKSATDQFLTFCIDPLADMCGEEITRQRYKFEEFAKKNYLRIDTRKIRHVDLLGMAANIDKLISSAAYSINDVREAAGDERIDEPWADEHFITKNYSKIDEAVRSVLQSGGGEGDGSG